MARTTDRDGNPLPPAHEVSWPRNGPLGYVNRDRQRGRSVQLGGAGFPLEGIVLQAGTSDDHDIGESLAGLVALTLDYADANNQNTLTPQYAQAVVQWGTEGQQNELVCDYLRGTVVHVSGSFFRVIARLAPFTIEQGDPPAILADASVNLAATVGYWGGGRCRPQLTLQALAADDGEGVRARFRIPRYACEFTSTGSFNPTAFWKTADGLGNVIGAQGFDATNRLPIPGMAQYLEIGGAPPGAWVTVVFYLST